MLLLYFSVAPSNAVSWISLGELESGGSAYIDTSSIKRDGRFIKYWIKINIPWNKNPLDFYQVTNSMSQIVADCTKGEIQVLQSTEKNSGGYTHSYTKHGPIHDPAPGTIEEGAMSAACMFSKGKRR